MKTNTNFKAIINELEPAACTLVGSVAEDEIKAFESERGMNLPEDYRSFVREFGCGSIGAIEIFGLGVKPTGIPSLIWVLNDLRRLGLTPPVWVLPVTPLGDGTYAAILTTPRGAFAQGTVIRWTPGSLATKLDALGSSFSAYLKAEVGRQ